MHGCRLFIACFSYMGGSAVYFEISKLFSFPAVDTGELTNSSELDEYSTVDIVFHHAAEDG